MKGIATLPIAILICAGAAAAQDQQAESLKRLPPDIKTYLDKKYPDWKFLPLSAQVVECRDAETKLHPSLVRGDFNGDGIPDFAVQIVHAGRVHAFEFLSQGRTFRVNPLFEGKQVPGKEFRAALVLERKGQKTEVNTVEKVDTLNVNDCESVPMRFVYRNGRVKNESPRD